MSQALYRWFDKKGELLYLGITSGIGGRIKEHQRGSSWATQARFITLEWYDSRLEVERAERRAISREHPKENRAYNEEPGPPLQYPPIETWFEAERYKREVGFHKQLWERQRLIGDDNDLRITFLLGLLRMKGNK